LPPDAMYFWDFQIQGHFRPILSLLRLDPTFRR